MMIEQKPLSDEFSVLAFYGISHSAAAGERFFARTVQWFQSLGYAPDKLAVSHADRSGNILSFSRNAAKLQRSGFEDVSAFELYATTPDAKVWWSDCFLSADYESVKAGTHVFVTARSSIAMLGDASMAQMAQAIVSILRPMYGIGFNRQKKFGPGMYVIGVLKSPPGHISSGLEYEEELRICRWGDEGMVRQVYRQGYIRDVYPQNYLSNVHLGRKVGEVTFEQWIRQDASRGSLTKFSEEMCVWSVGPDAIQSVRTELRRLGIVFDWKQH
jgi:hypothetical protein